MNSELVNRLSTQAKDLVPKNTLDSELWIEQYNQNLVELVVLECVNILDTLEEAYNAPSTGGKIIKKVFGIDHENI